MDGLFRLSLLLSFGQMLENPLVNLHGRVPASLLTPHRKALQFGRREWSGLQGCLSPDAIEVCVDGGDRHPSGSSDFLRRFALSQENEATRLLRGQSKRRAEGERPGK